jgi:hypothetical protein
MTTHTSIIRPGLLVSLKTNVVGGVSYQKVTLEADHSVGEKQRRARWETTRQITDAEEHEAAVITRGKCRSVVAAVCCPSSHGLLCPQSNEDKLTAAIAEAHELANAFNVNAVHTRVEVYVITGRVADSDQQAAAAIGAEVRDLIDAMQKGVAAADPKAIRAAANEARAMAGMLSADVQDKVSKAIAEVRTVARDIVRRVEKTGETAASIVNGLQLERLNDARIAVLDLTGDFESADQLSLPVAGRALELEASNDDATTRGAVAGRALDLGA